jgi:hypothetical protein
MVTLPEGGRISYTYTGGSQGINCADGSAAILTRELNDDPGGASSWQYASSTPNGAGTTHTEVLDGNGNHIAYDFVLYNGSPYETLRQVYQTVESGTPNVSKATCYNASIQPCTTTAISAAISQLDTYNTLDGDVENGMTQTVSSAGLITQEEDYDFGTSARGSVLQTTNIVYTSLNLPSIIYTSDPSGNIFNHVLYGYDENSLTTTSGLPQHTTPASTRCNLTSINYPNNEYHGWSVTSAQYWYDDAGQIRTSEDANLNATTYIRLGN